MLAAPFGQGHGFYSHQRTRLGCHLTSSIFYFLHFLGLFLRLLTHRLLLSFFLNSLD